jgi:prolyl-tRNA synthetase
MQLQERLALVCRCQIDARDQYTPGWKFNEYELKGVPLRLELGPKDLAKDQCVLVRRDTREKIFCPLAELETRVVALLDQIQKDMLARARAFRDENTRTVANYEEFQQVMEEKRGFIYAPWCGNGECELKIKEDTKATIRCLPLDDENRVVEAREGNCIRCGAPAKFFVYFARAY